MFTIVSSLPDRVSEHKKKKKTVKILSGSINDNIATLEEEKDMSKITEANKGIAYIKNGK